MKTNEQIKKLEDKHESFGSVEGRLCYISSSSGNYIGIKDEIFSKDIRCEISSEILDEFILNAKDFYNKRVSVAGKVEYKGSTPIKVYIEKIYDIKVFEDEGALPSFKDIWGILK
jgi:hypothetical protein